MLGKWSARTRVTSLLELDAVQAACITLGIEEGLRPLREQLLANLPQVAILVGYSALHHELAGFFKQNNVPVILYEITPQQALKGVNLDEARDRIKVALSIQKSGSAFIRAANIPFHYIGTPYRDRVAKVDVKASAFPFLNGKPLVTLFPGGYGEALQQMLPLFGAIAAGLGEEIQVVVSLREELDYEQTVTHFKTFLPDPDKVSFVLGMHLELLSLSRVAITGSGAITMEAAIALKPFMPIYDKDDKADEVGSFTLVNQSLGKRLVPEYSNKTPMTDILSRVKSLLIDGAERKALITDLQNIASEFQGSAADNAADYIVQETGLSKKRERPPVTPG